MEQHIKPSQPFLSAGEMVKWVLSYCMYTHTQMTKSFTNGFCGGEDGFNPSSSIVFVVNRCIYTRLLMAFF
jgi:hypothetical protein